MRNPFSERPVPAGRGPSLPAWGSPASPARGWPPGRPFLQKGYQGAGRLRGGDEVGIRQRAVEMLSDGGHLTACCGLCRPGVQRRMGERCAAGQQAHPTALPSMRCTCKGSPTALFLVVLAAGSRCGGLRMPHRGGAYTCCAHQYVSLLRPWESMGNGLNPGRHWGGVRCKWIEPKAIFGCQVHVSPWAFLPLFVPFSSRSRVATNSMHQTKKRYKKVVVGTLIPVTIPLEVRVTQPRYRSDVSSRT